VRAGLVACTGNTGCRFAVSDTKRHAEEIARWCEARVELDAPINIHLTGCHHSCAQHYIGDIGLIACKVQTSEDGDAIEGYHILVGGGFGPDAAIARDLYRDVKAEDAPPTVERMTMADGRPLRRRMMAAMAQQDCGQCGYNCHDYSEAIFLKKEERLNLCVPGGKETARMVKKLYEETGSAPAVVKGEAPMVTE